MNTQDVIESLNLPPDTLVGQRVPKKLFLEQGAPTASDKRAIQSGLEEVVWVAALKPSNIGVPSFKEEAREYLEIAVLAASFREAPKRARLTELIHRAIPYPLLLVAAHSEGIAISLAHKRASQAEKDAVVLDGALVEVSLVRRDDEHVSRLLENMTLGRQPTQDLYRFYSGWIERLQAFQAARLTGTYTLTQTNAQSLVRQSALADHANIVREIAMLRAKANRERQINRRVEINLAIQRLEEDLRLAEKKLEGNT